MNRHATLTPKIPSDFKPADQRSDHGTAVAQITEALNGLRFGAIAIVVHDGRVTQIDVTEKRRLTV
jgi:hypothetical protein